MFLQYLGLVLVVAHSATSSRVYQGRHYQFSAISNKLDTYITRLSMTSEFVNLALQIIVYFISYCRTQVEFVLACCDDRSQLVYVLVQPSDVIFCIPRNKNKRFTRSETVGGELKDLNAAYKNLKQQDEEYISDNSFDEGRVMPLLGSANDRETWDDKLVFF